MLTEAKIEAILTRLPSLTVGVLGDLFLDRYLDIDATLTEPSLETGLDAYQVTRVRPSPGAAGTVLNNLVALGVGRVCPISFVGDDGEGYELQAALRAMPAVDMTWLLFTTQRRTPTYTKPMLNEPGKPPRELNRLDLKNRTPTPQTLEAELLRALDAAWPRLDALVVLDQVSEENCGVITRPMREHLAQRAASDPGRFVLADSRERIDQFRQVCIKPNETECRRVLGLRDEQPLKLEVLRSRVGGMVFCTRGERGILLADAGGVREVPGFPVQGPIDIVGAGDATSAGIACAVAAGMSPEDAASFGNLAASITIRQIGTTGTASPRQVRERWREMQASQERERPQ